MTELRLILLIGAFFLIQALVGGTRLLFAIPAYTLIAIAACSGVVGRRGGLTRPGWVCVASALLLAGWVVARACTSPVEYLARTDLYMVMACLLAYGLAAWFLTSLNERLVVVGMLLVIALAEIGVGIRQYTGGDDFMLFHFIRASYGKRASGFFVHSIHLAGYLEAVGVIGLSLACWSRWRMEARLAVGFVALLCYMGVVITGSRGGYISVAFSVFFFGIMSLWLLARIDHGKFLVALIVGTIVFLSCGFATIQIMNRSPFLAARLNLLGEQFSGDTGKLDIRKYNWAAALDQFRVSPWVGTGAGTHLYYGRQFRRSEVKADPEHAHSDYLELIAEYGIVGAGVMLLFLVAHIASGVRATFRSLKEDVLPFAETRDTNLALQVGLLAAVAAYIAHSVVDFNMHIPGNALMFAVFFGMLANPRPTSTGVAGWSVQTILPRAVFPVVALCLVGLSLPKLHGEYWGEKARVALRDQNYGPALEYSEKALQTERSNPFLYFYQGQCYRIVGTQLRFRVLRDPRLESAVAAYDRGLALFPWEENLLVRKGQALDQLQRYGEAEQAYQSAVRLDPNLGAVHAYYAAHLRLRQRWEEAEKEQVKALILAGEDLPPNLRHPPSVTELRPPGSGEQ